MLRRPRINLAGHPQHVVQRGHNHEACFFADEDYLFYLWERKVPESFFCRWNRSFARQKTKGTGVDLFLTR